MHEVNYVRVVSLDKGEKRREEQIQEIACLYCEIWKESPWNEHFWTPERVVQDVHQQLLEPKAVLLYAVEYCPSEGCCQQESYKIIGFTWGYEVDEEKLCEISGISGWKFLFGEDDNPKRKVFYVDELAVGKDWRGEGYGRELTQELIKQAAELGINCLILRTEKKAIAARTLYQRLGFRETDVVDTQYPDRTYWVKK